MNFRGRKQYRKILQSMRIQQNRRIQKNQTIQESMETELGISTDFLQEGSAGAYGPTLTKNGKTAAGSPLGLIQRHRRTLDGYGITEAILRGQPAPSQGAWLPQAAPGQPNSLPSHFILPSLQALAPSRYRAGSNAPAG